MLTSKFGRLDGRHRPGAALTPRTRSRWSTWPRTCACALVWFCAASALAGCIHAPKWVAQRNVTTDMVAQALDEPPTAERRVKPAEIPEIPPRTNLRPCCAFGTELRATLGPVPIPFFSIDNVISADQLGPHMYDSGAFATEGSSQKNAYTSEDNGILYTCRGGFIDTAHVRDYADWTLFWSAAIARSMETGGTVAIPPEGGHRRVHLKPVPTELIEHYGLRRLSIKMGQWVAFQLSIWHEIVTWYGWSSIEAYPEYVSAFSPEDLYSNLLGIKIAGGLLSNAGSAETDSLYDHSMDQWLPMSLAYLQPVSVKAGNEATHLVDGVWWNSKARLPDPHLVLRRNFDITEFIKPWLISDAYTSPEMQAWINRECGGQQSPLVLQRPRPPQGFEFLDYLTVEIDVDVPDPFPFPRPGSTQITQADFPAIIHSIRQESAGKFGPGSDRPQRMPNELAAAPTESPR